MIPKGNTMGSTNNLVRLNVNAVYGNGVDLFKDRIIVADSQLSALKPNGSVRVVTLRFAMPAAEAEQLDHAFHTGNAELSLDSVRQLDV